MFAWKHKSVLLPTASYLVMIRNGPQNQKRVLWIILSIAYTTATAKPIHSAKSASTSPSTNYPRQPALSIDQAHGCVINVVAISNSVLRPNTKSPVKRQLDLHVSLKKKSFAMQVCLCTTIISLLGLSWLSRKNKRFNGKIIDCARHPNYNKPKILCNDHVYKIN